MVHQAVDHRRGHDLVTKDLAQAEKGLLLVTMSEARSQRLETSRNISYAASSCARAFNGQSDLRNMVHHTTAVSR